MKKKLVMGFIVFTIITASVQVYAATYLNTNIIDLITQGVNSITNRFISTANTDSENIDSQYMQKVADYISDKTRQVNKEIETHKNNEINRANQEVSSYFETVKKEADTVFNAQIKQAKASITANVNNNVQNIKNNINKEIEKQLKEKLK